jgi:hypothetical protein
MNFKKYYNQNIVVYYQVQNGSTGNVYRSKQFTIQKDKLKSFLSFLKSLQSKGYYKDFRSEGQPPEDGFSVYSGQNKDGIIYSFAFVPEQNWEQVASDYFPDALEGKAGTVNVDHGDLDEQPPNLPIVDEEELENEILSIYNKYSI